MGYLADNVAPNQDNNINALNVYKGKLKQLFARQDFIATNNLCSVICVESDIMNFSIESPADIVVTSPPYPFAVDFIRYHRLALYWLEKNVEEISDQEVGARNKRNKRNALSDFFIQFEKIYIHIMKMVKDGGFWCMTIGNTTRQKQYIDFIGWTIELFEKNGWVLVSNEVRNLTQQTMAQKRIPTENILIFQKKV